MNLLIVGTSTDGPDNLVYRPKNERNLRELFGANYIQRFIATPQASSVALRYEPFVLPSNVYRDRRENLYFPYLSSDRTTYYFGNIGGSSNVIVDLHYTPYLGKSDLIYSGRRFILENGETPYVARIGGNKATITIDQWEFEAKYSGSKYNLLALTVGVSSINISGLEPNYPTVEYVFTYASQFKELMYRDFDAGVSPVHCTMAGSALPTPGTYFLSGGTDGTITQSSLNYFLSYATIPADVTHVLVLASLSSGFVSEIARHLSSRNVQPRLFIFPSPDFSEPTESWVNNQVFYIPYRHNMVASIVGDITTDVDGRFVSRYAAEGASFAFHRKEGYNLTNIPILARDFSPVLSETSLNYMKAGGWIPLMRYIKNDIATYEGVCSYAENTFLFNSKLAEVCSIAYNYCFQFLGMNLSDGDQPAITSALSSRLLGISFFTLERVRVYTVPEIMYVEINGYVESEILRISFTLKNT